MKFEKYLKKANNIIQNKEHHHFNHKKQNYE